MDSESASRELRIAPVMTGGTSLAIWMGGATTELHRVLRCAASPPDPSLKSDVGMQIYDEILQFTDTAPIVDVITGTSAGGLNGTLLGAAVVLGVSAEDFRTIRDTWLTVADLEQLLRKATEPDPPSLLMGDDYFVPKIEDKLRTWARDYPGFEPEKAPSIDLLTTLTTVTPEPVTRTDDFGEQINAVTNAQSLRFTTDSFRDADWVEKVAIASRTSASIPGVFEPSFLPHNAEHAKASKRPDFSREASFDKSRWALDGGLVVNLPLTEALSRIFDQSSSKEVRRIALYVCPTPSTRNEPDADKPDEMPSIRTSLTTIVTAARAEGVSGDIDQLQRENAAVARQERARQALTRVAPRLNVTKNVFTLYTARRAETSVATMLRSLQVRTKTPLPYDESRLERCFQVPRQGHLPKRLADFGPPWNWGIAPIEQAVSIALGLLRRSIALTNPNTVRGKRDNEELIKAKTLVHEARREVVKIRKHDSDYWAARFLLFESETTVLEDPAKGLVGAKLDDKRDEAIAAWAKTSYEQWPVMANEKDDLRGATLVLLAAIHRKIAEALRECGDAMGRVAFANRDRDDGLGNELTALGWQIGRTVTRPTLPTLRQKLLAYHVLQTVMLGDVVNREQRVDLMQVSSNAYNALDPTRTPAEKLAGPELARLGAFLKPSWRANDWFWGRMDACYRLLLLLLDPARMKQLAKSADEVISLLVRLGVDAPSEEIRMELSFLAANSTQPIPKSLPSCARAVAEAAQTVIAQQELPEMLIQVRRSLAEGAAEGDDGAFRQAVERALGDPPEPTRIDTAKAKELVAKMRIGTETPAGEFGFRRTNRLMTHAAAVLVNAVSSPKSGLPGMNRVFKRIRPVLQALNSVVSLMTTSGPLGQAFTAISCTAAATIIALRFTGTNVSGLAVSVSAALLTGLGVAALWRSGFRWLGAVFLMIAATVGLTVAGPDIVKVAYTCRQTSSPQKIDVSVDSLHVHVQRADSPNPSASVDGKATATTEDPAEKTCAGKNGRHVAPWKTWGFLHQYGVVELLLLAYAIFAALKVLKSRLRLSKLKASLIQFAKLERANREGPPLSEADKSRLEKLKQDVAEVKKLKQTGFGGIVDLLVSAVLFATLPKGAHWALTGEASKETSGVKHFLVKYAEVSHGYQLPVVLGTLTAVSIALGLGFDLWANRAGRWLRRRSRHERPRVT